MIGHIMYIWVVVVEIIRLYRYIGADYGMSHLWHRFWHFSFLDNNEGDVSRDRHPIKLSHYKGHSSGRYFDFLRMKSRVENFLRPTKLRMVKLSSKLGGWSGIMTPSLENAILVPGWKIGFFGTSRKKSSEFHGIHNLTDFGFWEICTIKLAKLDHTFDDLHMVFKG
jgi:hypothetical protein